MSLAKIPVKGDEEGMAIQDGVIISHKEMYQSQQEVVKTLNRLESRMETRMESLEVKMESLIQADERSRDAIEKAKDAETEAGNAHKRIKRIEEKLDKIMISIVLTLITGAIGALFYFAQSGVGG